MNPIMNERNQDEVTYEIIKEAVPNLQMGPNSHAVYSHVSLPLVVHADPNLLAIEVEVNFKLVLVDCCNRTLEPLRTFTLHIELYPHALPNCWAPSQSRRARKGIICSH